MLTKDLMNVQLSLQRQRHCVSLLSLIELLQAWILLAMNSNKEPLVSHGLPKISNASTVHYPVLFKLIVLLHWPLPRDLDRQNRARAVMVVQRAWAEPGI